MSDKANNNFIKAISNWILDFLYPKNVVCWCCQNEALLNENYLCSNCAAKIKICPSILPQIDGLDGFTSGIKYDDLTAPVIQRFKYNDQRFISQHLVQYMSVPIEWEIDYVVPVPLHKSKLKKRGYNQSLLLANALAAKDGLVLNQFLLYKTKKTMTQTKLTKLERQKNIKSSFMASSDVFGKRILLVDDVKTSGATLKECAKTLKKGGATAVYAITAAIRA